MGVTRRADKRIVFLLVVTLLNVLGNAALALPASVPHDQSCPEDLLFKFPHSITTRAEAEKAFSEFFLPSKGYPPFDPAMIKGPYNEDPAVPRGSYSYFGWYGAGKSKVGGLLYPDGRLVQRGYCK